MNKNTMTKKALKVVIFTGAEITATTFVSRVMRCSSPLGRLCALTSAACVAWMVAETTSDFMSLKIDKIMEEV